MKNTMFTKTMSALLIALLVLAILPVVPAYAAVAVPGQWSAVALIDNATASPQNATYAVPAGLDRLMVVSVTIEYSASAVAQTITATYGGQALTMITQVSGQRQNSWVGYLNEAGIIAAADTTLAVTYNNTSLTGVTVHAATYSGVDQATPIAGSNSLYLSGAAVTSITYGVNIPVVAGGYIFYVTNDNNGTATHPAGYTEHFDQAFAQFSKSVASEAVAVNGTENQTINLVPGASRYALSVVSLNPAPADVTAPSVTSFTLRTPASSPTNSDTLVFRAIFSEAVTNVNAADFAVNSTSTATVTGVNTINSSTYDITISGGDLAGFDGTVNLNLSGAQNITDIATNPLPTLEPGTDQTYTVDNTAPTVSIGAPSVSLTSAGPVTFAITVSGANTINLTTADITLNSTGTAAGTVSVTNGGTANPTVTVSTITGNGTLGISIGAAIASDTAGNNSLAAGPSTTFTVDNTTLSVVINQAVAQTDPTGISPINFTVVFNKAVADFIDSDVTLGGTAGATTATVTGGPTTYNVAVSGMTLSGTVTASLGAGVATDAAANPNTASTTADNNVTFSLSGPVVVVANGINTVPDTGNGSLSEFEVTTVGITQFRVTFSQDVTNLGAGDPDSVTNPANYILVRDLGDTAGFQTVSCVAGGAATPNDTSFAINSVSYTNGAGAGPFVATVNVNGGLPLSSGNYRLYVCGTTSITNLVGTPLAGNGVAAGTDFIRNFTVAPVVAGGGGGGGGATSVAKATLPLTGFAPDKVTDLPAQPADVVYKSMGKMSVEIPTLGINFPIVGAALSENSWDLTWLQNNVAYLEGSAYPTWMGNSVLTAHVTDANSNIGPFSDIKGMQIGDNIYVHDGYGSVYVYQVQENKKILASNTNSVFKHQQYNWVTLVTCEDYNANTGMYTHRRIVRAVLISVIPEKK